MGVIFHIHPLDESFDFLCNVGADVLSYTIPFVFLTLVDTLWVMAKCVIHVIKIVVSSVMYPMQ